MNEKTPSNNGTPAENDTNLIRCGRNMYEIHKILNKLKLIIFNIQNVISYNRMV